MEVDRNCCTYCNLTCHGCHRIIYKDKIDCDRCDKQLCTECTRHISKIDNIKVCKNLCQPCFEIVSTAICGICHVPVNLRDSAKCRLCRNRIDVLRLIESCFR